MVRTVCSEGVVRVVGRIFLTVQALGMFRFQGELELQLPLLARKTLDEAYRNTFKLPDDGLASFMNLAQENIPSEKSDN